jgi:DNA repair protein RadC
MIYKAFKTIKAVYERTEEYKVNAPRVTSSSDVFSWFRDLQDETKEHFLALHLDSKNRVLCIDQVSTGSLNASIVHPREVFKVALLSSAAAVVFVHNHPSGDLELSREDIELTARLNDAGKLLGIRVMDHVVVGENGYVSFADRGLL